MRLGEVAAASADVAATSSRLEKVALLAALLRGPSSGRGAGRHRLPVGWAAAGLDRRGLGGAARPAVARCRAPSLELLEVDAALRRVGSPAGAGVTGRAARGAGGAVRAGD